MLIRLMFAETAESELNQEGFISRFEFINPDILALRSWMIAG